MRRSKSKKGRQTCNVFQGRAEALIANANSSLEDLEVVLRRAQARSGHGGALDASDGDVVEIQTQIDSIRQRILAILLGIRESYKHDQERLSALEGELKLYLENATVRHRLLHQSRIPRVREVIDLLVQTSAP
jgi:hypothetical protein